ncbi:flagellar biosynthetic protein FliR [Limimaricola sp. AA108-03]|uniref:flagellar biosynthetic protein FliR n=1 Tax=Limimaricola sp. AA108-03 TaxID=3425945 RepID=UPI003D7842A9
MTDPALSLLLDQGRDGLWAAMLVFLRVGTLATLLPVFGEQLVPVRVRFAAALGFAAVLLPMLAPLMATLPGGAGARLAQGGAEIVAGLALGLMLRLFVVALQVAGTMAAQSTSLAQLTGGTATDPAPAIGQVLILGGLALAALSGLHLRAAEYMLLSYEILPPGQFPDPAALAEAGLAQVARIFGLGFVLAAPFLIAALVYNLTLGVINRAMPQLMVAFIGAPAITGGALLLLWLSAPLLLPIWRAALWGFMGVPFGAGP